MAETPETDPPAGDLPSRPLSRRTPVPRGEAIETEKPEVVDRVASLLGEWAAADDDPDHTP